MARWLAESFSRFEGAPEAVFSNHIDEIDPSWDSSSWGASDGVNIFRKASALVPAAWDLRLSLAIPLGMTSALNCTPPKLTAIAVNSDEPPSLYVFGPRFYSNVVNDREEYRCPYLENPWGLKPPHEAVEFVCSRDVGSRVRGWEFTCDLWLHRLAI